MIGRPFLSRITSRGTHFKSICHIFYIESSYFLPLQICLRRPQWVFIHSRSHTQRFFSILFSFVKLNSIFCKFGINYSDPDLHNFMRYTESVEGAPERFSFNAHGVLWGRFIVGLHPLYAGSMGFFLYHSEVIKRDEMIEVSYYVPHTQVNNERIFFFLFFIDRRIKDFIMYRK